MQHNAENAYVTWVHIYRRKQFQDATKYEKRMQKQEVATWLETRAINQTHLHGGVSEL